mmetsp:Transcript_15454/g.39374  ORF Transcript_15454/g.39374 Transcript_15454/m.39374 type:complete len:219 (+) Transcript_15454:482-1138(+)
MSKYTRLPATGPANVYNVIEEKASPYPLNKTCASVFFANAPPKLCPVMYKVGFSPFLAVALSDLSISIASSSAGFRRFSISSDPGANPTYIEELEYFSAISSHSVELDSGQGNLKSIVWADNIFCNHPNTDRIKNMLAYAVPSMPMTTAFCSFSTSTPKRLERLPEVGNMVTTSKPRPVNQSEVVLGYSYIAALTFARQIDSNGSKPVSSTSVSTLSE